MADGSDALPGGPIEDANEKVDQILHSLRERDQRIGVDAIRRQQELVEPPVIDSAPRRFVNRLGSKVGKNPLACRFLRPIWRFVKSQLVLRDRSNSLSAQRHQIGKTFTSPTADSSGRLTLITAVAGGETESLRVTLESCLTQTDRAFSHVIIYSGADDESVLQLLGRYQQLRRNTVLLHSQSRPDPAQQYAWAMDHSSNDYFAFVAVGDQITPDAIALCNERLGQGVEVDLLVGDWRDDTKLHSSSRIMNLFSSRLMKLPAWSPERLRGSLYLDGLLVFNKIRIDELGGISGLYPGAEIHDLLLRLSEHQPIVAQLPLCLYIKNRSGQTSESQAVTAQELESGRRAIQDHCDRMGIDSMVTLSDHPGFFSHQRHPQKAHRLSVVIPTAGKRTMIGGDERYLVMNVISSLLATPFDTEIEVVCVSQPNGDNGWQEAARDLLGDRLIVIEDKSEEFNFAKKVNLGAAISTGDFLLFLNDDVEGVPTNWLNDLTAIAEQSDVGAVGPVLLLENDLIQHAGHSYHDGNPWHIFCHETVGPRDFGDFFVDHEMSGITAACLLQRRTVWEEVGGFSETLPNNFNDVDYCLKVSSLGYRIVLCSSARLVHFESVSRDPTVEAYEIEQIHERWLSDMLRDSYTRL